MATKLYFIQDLPLYTPSAWHGGWNAPGNAPGLDGDPGPLQSLDPDKYGIGSGSMLSQGVIPTTPYTRGIVQLVSRPLLPQTISGTVDSIYATRESNLAHNLYTRLHIYVINCTTNAVHGILLNQYEETLTEWATASVPVGRALQAVQPINTVTIPNDGVKYRIIVEWGYKSLATAGTNVKGYVEIGARTDYAGSLRADMTVGSLSNSTTGYLQFSANLTFEPHVIPNLGPETAIPITTLPFTTTFDPLKKSGEYGTDYLVGGGYWYKINPSKNEIINLICHNPTGQDANYITYLEVGTPPYPLVLYVEGNVHGFGEMVRYIALKIGEVIYIRIYLYNYAPGTTITLTVKSAPTATIKAGDLFISTDDSGVNKYDSTLLGARPSTFIDPTTQTVKSMTGTLPGSELGVTLANGKWGLVGVMFAPQFRTLYIYDKPPTLAPIIRVIPNGDSTGGIGNTSGAIIRSIGTDFISFYVILAASTSDLSVKTLYKISDAGVIDPVTYTLQPVRVGIIPGGSAASAGVSRDGAVLYYGRAISGGAILRHNLVNNTIMADLAPAIGPDYIPGDVIVLKNGNIAVVWSNNFRKVSEKVVIYDINGTIVQTLDFGGTYWRVHHITHDAKDDPNKLWVWTQDAPEDATDGSKAAIGYHFLINLTTSLKEKTFSFHNATSGVGTHIDNLEDWVPANSCPLMIMMGDDGGSGGGGNGGGGTPTPGPPAPDGIYFINPTKATRHDSYYNAIEKKIPNPIIKTALLGE